jgi:hypothetical protein
MALTGSECSTYQDYLAKSLTERYHGLSAHLDNTIKGANSEMKNLEIKLRGSLPLAPINQSGS